MPPFGVDWMLPEAWNVEHNNLHHYHLGEDSDPDLVERNLVFLRGLDIPAFMKYLIVGFFMISWKWFLGPWILALISVPLIYFLLTPLVKRALRRSLYQSLLPF